MKHRKIIHLAMDAFYVSVEELDNPSLRGKPVVVGHDGPRGVVSTANYVARQYGIHSALPIAVAHRLCSRLVVVEPHFNRYKEVSRQVHEIFHEYTDLVEPISLDEAFLDVTENKPGIELAVDIAREIKQKIHERLQLTASAGISYNKLLAKIASDWRKPNGLTTIHPDRAQEFIDQLRIEKIWGVGPKTAEAMHHMGIFTGADLRKISQERLTQAFGKMGAIFYQFARGIDERPVIVDYERKSVGCEQTFEKDISSKSALIIELYHTVIELERRLAKSDFKGTTLTLKVKYENFEQHTHSITGDKVLRTKDDILPLAKRLLKDVALGNHYVRLIGLSVSNPPRPESQRKWIELELEFEPWD
jgi:DNA polymerase-4